MRTEQIMYCVRGETFIFRFNVLTELQIVMAIAGLAQNPEVDFTWSDAFIIKQLILGASNANTYPQTR